MLGEIEQLKEKLKKQMAEIDNIRKELDDKVKKESDLES